MQGKKKFHAFEKRWRKQQWSMNIFWKNTSVKQHDTVTHDAVTHDTVTHDAVTYDTVTHDAVTYDTVTHDAVTHDTVMHDARVELVTLFFERSEQVN